MAAFQVPGEYVIDRKGFFVLLVNTNFTENENLRYEIDVEHLAKTFNLKKDGEWRPNVVVGENLNNNESEDSKEKKRNFDNFFQTKVLQYDGDPSFVVCFVLSHGNEDSFVLAESYCDTESGGCSGSVIAGWKHSYEKTCKKRNLYRDIINPINNSPKFQGIPKVFVVQFCRGNRHNTIQITTAPDALVSGHSSNPGHNFHSPADYYIVFPAVYGHPAFLQENRSVVVSELLKATEQLLKQYDQLKQKRRKTQTQGMKVHEEDQIGGWIENIGTSIRGAVPTDLYNSYSQSEAGTWRKVTHFLKSLPFNRVEKSQPECVSTLRKKLSWLKIVLSQL